MISKFGFWQRGNPLRAEELRGTCCFSLQELDSLPKSINGYYANSALKEFPEPTAYTPYLIARAKEALRTLFKEGFLYKEVGVELISLVPSESYQRDLFMENNNEEKQKVLMKTVDRLNRRYGDEALKYAAEGISPRRVITCSPRFTSCWNEILTIKI